MSLKSRVVALRELPAGEAVSYGGLWRARVPSKIATVPIGYADGYTRRMTGKAEVLVGGRRCAVAGAITMDMCMVDVTGVDAKLGDEVVLLGAQGPDPSARIGADELAAWAGTISWEIFCGISKRVPRVYVGERW
jgi:alanine racemase